MFYGKFSYWRVARKFFELLTIDSITTRQPTTFFRCKKEAKYYLVSSVYIRIFMVLKPLQIAPTKGNILTARVMETFYYFLSFSFFNLQQCSQSNHEHCSPRFGIYLGGLKSESSTSSDMGATFVG